MELRILVPPRVIVLGPDHLPLRVAWLEERAKSHMFHHTHLYPIPEMFFHFQSYRHSRRFMHKGNTLSFIGSTKVILETLPTAEPI